MLSPETHFTDSRISCTQPRRATPGFPISWSRQPRPECLFLLKHNKNDEQRKTLLHQLFANFKGPSEGSTSLTRQYRKRTCGQLACAPLTCPPLRGGETTPPRRPSEIIRKHNSFLFSTQQNGFQPDEKSYETPYGKTYETQQKSYEKSYRWHRKILRKILQIIKHL